MDNSKTIQWYPGHMAKAKRLMKEKLKLIDVVFELVDARCPFSSKNPYLDEIAKQKSRVLLLNKADLADDKQTDKFITYYKDKGVIAIKINSTNKKGAELALKSARLAFQDKQLKLQEKGLKERAIRIMIVGIPNVGKSTLINSLAKKKVATIGDVAGITKTNQWITLASDIVLLDTPGILWNKFSKMEQGYHLALVGAIKKSILPIDDVVIYGIKFLLKYYYENMNSRYQLTNVDTSDVIAVLDHIGRQRGCLIKNNEIDYDRVYNLFLDDLRLGYLGKVTYDRIG